MSSEKNENIAFNILKEARFGRLAADYSNEDYIVFAFAGHVLRETESISPELNDIISQGFDSEEMIREAIYILAVPEDERVKYMNQAFLAGDHWKANLAKMAGADFNYIEVEYSMQWGDYSDCTMPTNYPRLDAYLLIKYHIHQAAAKNDTKLKLELEKGVVMLYDMRKKELSADRRMDVLQLSAGGGLTHVVKELCEKRGILPEDRVMEAAKREDRDDIMKILNRILI